MSEPHRVLIVDDEPPARLLLASYLAEHPDFCVAGECGSVRDAVAFLAREGADAVLLDIQLSDGSGFEVVERMDPARAPPVVFVTAYDEHAVRAFEVSAVDYLLKPVTAERFDAAMDRLRTRLGAGRDPAGLIAAIRMARELLAGVGEPPRRGRAGYLGVRTGDGVQVIPVGTVRYLEVEGHYVTIHTTAGSHLARGRLSDFEEQLDPDRFVRIHRSTIVNLDQVRALTPWFRGDYLVHLHDGTELRMSRTYRANLEGRFVAEW